MLPDGGMFYSAESPDGGCDFHTVCSAIQAANADHAGPATMLNLGKHAQDMASVCRTVSGSEIQVGGRHVTGPGTAGTTERASEAEPKCGGTGVRGGLPGTQGMTASDMLHPGNQEGPIPPEPPGACSSGGQLQLQACTSKKVLGWEQSHGR